MKLGVSATGQSKVLRTVIVDDSALARLLLRDALSLFAGVRVVGNASEGQAALEVVDAVLPDLVTLDIDMPGANALDLLRELKLRHPSLTVFVFGRQNGPGVAAFSQAIALGAAATIETPISKNRDENLRQLRSKVAGFLLPLVEQHRSGDSSLDANPLPIEDHNSLSLSGTLSLTHAPASATIKHSVGFSTSLDPVATDKVGLVLVGSSTGGPAALRTLLSGLSPNLQVPVCVVQHIPPGFSKPLAQRLNEYCPLTVIEAAEGMEMLPGHVYLAPGGRHLRIHGTPEEPTLQLDEGEVENGCRPAIDVTLRSALSVYGARTLVVILTGMGRDGAVGAEAIRSRGGKVFVQTPDSCTVSSMPRQAIEMAGADAIGELNELSQWINEAAQ